MKKSNLTLVKAFLQRDAEDYSQTPSNKKRAEERNVEIIDKIKGKENGQLIINIFSNMGITMQTLEIKMGEPSNYYRIINLGSNPHEYGIGKSKTLSQGGLHDMTNIEGF